MKNDKIETIGSENNTITSEIVLYQSEQSIKLAVRVESETVWLNLSQAEHSKKINFFVRTALPALEGIFYGKRKDCFPIFRTVTRNIRLGIV